MSALRTRLNRHYDRCWPYLNECLGISHSVGQMMSETCGWHCLLRSVVGVSSQGHPCHALLPHNRSRHPSSDNPACRLRLPSCLSTSCRMNCWLDLGYLVVVFVRVSSCRPFASPRSSSCSQNSSPSPLNLYSVISVRSLYYTANKKEELLITHP